MKLAIIRKTQLITLALTALAGLASAPAETESLRLENDRYLVEVGLPNGVISRIRDKVGGLELLQEPRLADNFKFSLPIRKRYAWQSTEANYVLGREQRVTFREATASKLSLVWGGPMKSVIGKRYNVSATMTIELAGADIRFSFRIRNGSKLEIGEVYCPILGGSLGLGEALDVRKQTELVLPGLRDVRRERIFHTFANHSWLGVLGPEQYYSYPDNLSMPWLELCQPALNRGVYLGAHDPVARYKVIHLEMSPGIAGARPDGNWPRAEELNGLPVGVKLCFVYFPYQPAGQEFEAAPVVLRAHGGDWSEGARAYGQWFASTGDLRAARQDWPYRAPALQECEGLRFNELPERAKKAKSAGITSLLLMNWRDRSAADSGVPRYEPDSRLGSREEFADAIRQCHNLGVRVMVVADLAPASRLTEAFQNELQDFVCQDRWGISCDSPPGLTAGTPDQSPLTGGFGAGERRSWINPGHPKLRRLLVKQVRELAMSGVDGVHLQQFFARPLDFNPTVRRSPDRASWEGGLECVREILQACRAVTPGFAVSTDAVWDRMLPLSLVSSAEVAEQCPLRLAFPFWQPTRKVEGDDNIGAINQALLSSAGLRIVPYHRQPAGGLAPAGVNSYLEAVLAVREALKQTLLDGERVDAAALQIDGRVTRALFRNNATGQRTGVLVNNRQQPARVRVKGFAEPGRKPVWLWLPSQGTTNLVFPGQIEIPGRELAILTEEGAIGCLNALARWKPPVWNEQVVFDLESSEDLEGWILEGGAFTVSSLAGLVPKPTLNSIAAQGETATGTALSPPVEIEPGFDHMELLFQGGRSVVSKGEQNLVVLIIDAQSGDVIQEILPPGTHELTTRRVPLDKLRGRTVRFKLVDKNTASSYAWIGLRKVTLKK